MNSRVVVNSREIETDSAQASIEPVQPGVYSVLDGGRSYEVRIVTSPDGYLVEVDGQIVRTEIADPRDTRRIGSAGQAKGGQRIAAAMPGKVIRILVAKGDAVDTGQGLIIVEAMKMQNEIRAAVGGVVTSVMVRPGETVAAGVTLITIE